MFALGQKLTFASQKACPLLPQKRTCALQNIMSAWGQKRTLPWVLFYLEIEATVRGRMILISVNSPGTVSISIEPPCCFTMIS